MRKKFLLMNSVTSLLSQVATVVCGLVLSRLILQYFGSSTNGLVASITQFLSFISFLEMGIGAVVKSNLYKPLAEGDNEQVSRIIVSCKRFYRNVARILMVYILLLTATFPLISKSEYGFAYTAMLVVIIAVSQFAQYYFGMPYQLLLNADQHTYVFSSIVCITLLANTLLSFILMAAGAGIHLVKLATSIVYVARPLLMKWYVYRHYDLDENIVLTEEPIKQKWNGVAQHLSFVVLNNTDIVILTLFSTFANVSVYTVYHNVTNGIANLITTISIGVSAMIGNVLYSESKERLLKVFSEVEYFFHITTVVIYTITGLLIVPFATVFTRGINDTNYYVPLFAIIITCAQASYSIRTPYETMVLAAGHYKETQLSAIIEASINVLVSIILVWKFGLIGVAIGTLVAMAYRTIYFVLYLRKNILNRSIFPFVKYAVIDVIQVLLCVGVSYIFPFDYTELTWLNLILYGIKVAIFVILICGGFNFAFCKEEVKQLLSMVKRKKT